MQRVVSVVLYLVECSLKTRDCLIWRYREKCRWVLGLQMEYRAVISHIHRGLPVLARWLHVGLICVLVEQIGRSIGVGLVGVDRDGGI